LRWAITELRATSESARADAHLLLAHTLRREREWLLIHDDYRLTDRERREFDGTIEQRKRGVPVAYIRGRWNFYGLQLEVCGDVLVPRPETEHLVEAALDFLKRREHSTRSAGPMRVLDVGTGSGAIGCAIAAALPNALVDFTDVSEAAIRVAQRNATALGIEERCRFFVGDLAAPLKRSRYACVVANLPYIPRAQLPRKPTPAAYEPCLALDGGKDGLELYRRWLPELPWLLEPPALAVLEAAPPTIEGLRAHARKQFPNADVRIGQDYCGRARFVSVSTGG
jgi:release factor glutamine methyltransferase